MPLTFSHPVIILPLNWLGKRWVSLTGLIAGSVAPDFEYFFRMQVMSVYSHTWLGALWFDVPVGILICFIYHNFVRQSFIKNLPTVLYDRLGQFNHSDWNAYFKTNVLTVILSVAIGAASHLFWDSFTHLAGYFVQRWQMFSPVHFFGMEVPLFKIIQHVSTVVGGIIIAIAVFQIPPKKSINRVSSLYWIVFSVMMLLVIAIRILTGLSIYEYWNVLVTAISGAILSFILTPVFIKVR